MKFLTPENIVERAQQLKAQRSNWETLWQEIADHVLPRKNGILVQRTEGEERNLQVFDNTAMRSNELLAALLHSSLTNPNEEFFEMSSGEVEIDQRDDVRKFLQKTTTMIHSVINGSNFQTEVHELYLDEGGFGTAAMGILEDDDTVVRFDTRFIGEILLAENARGEVNEIYLMFDRTARQLVSEFGEAALPEKVRKLFQENKEDKLKVIQAVYPRSYEPGAKVGVHEYLSQTILVEHKHTVKKKGFHEFPFVTPRWSKAAGEAYGRSPAMNALPEIRVLNVIVETTLEGAQKAVAPPLQAPDDGFVVEIDTTPNGISYYRAGSDDRIQPLTPDTRVDFGFQMIQEKQAKIRDCFYIDQLQTAQLDRQTATEVVTRKDEQMRFLGPMMGRMEAEFLRPLVDRVFAIMMRKGMIKNIPQILSGRNLQIRYSSFIAKTQRMGQAQSMLRAMQTAAPFIQADQRVLQNLDGDAALRLAFKIHGAPQEVLRDEDDVQAIREQEAQAQQQMQQQAMEQQQAETLGKAAPALRAVQSEGA